jgi:predicted ATPase/Tfp pilus assembly protein PilF
MGPELERYEVLRLLGAGGMGRVYLARHRARGTLHAIKLLKERSPRLSARLRTEGEAQRSLRHDNVLAVTEVVEASGAPALVLEYVAGPTLAELLGAGIPLSIAEIDALGRGILSGVAAAHARGWVHRDLKPGNVLLRVTDDGLVPKVADFGLAKVLGEDEAIAGSTTRAGLGTRRYMSFEQLSGAPAEPSMDVFSLGAVLFELIEIVPAFPTLAAWEDGIRRGQRPALTRRDLPERMRLTVQAALSERGSRPGDARELLARWAGEVSLSSPAFRPETLRAAAWCASHLPQDLLESGAWGPAEEAHLSMCARCRVAAALARQRGESESTFAGDPHEPVPLLSWRGEAALAEEVRRRHGLLRASDAHTGFASFDSAVEALHCAIAMHRSDSSVQAALHLGLPAASEGWGRELLAVARPSQTLCTREMLAALGRAVRAPGEGGPIFVSHGHWRWADRVASVELFEVGHEQEAPLVSPLPSPQAWPLVLRDGAWVPQQLVQHHLPAETDRFLGREGDLVALARAASEGASLLLLHGAAGIGKTRLAVRYAWTWLGAWPGGAWFCDLADARSLEGIAAAVARALDVPLGKADPVVQLGHAIAGRGRCLLVLDNFEQLTEHAADTLGRWAARAPQAVFLVTSRSLLGLGERVLELEPLEEELGVALFIERASALRRDIDWPREREHVRQLVGMLDGLPLCIELCAARVRTLLPGQIASRMGERFRVLAGGEGRPDRQETLRAALDWSHELLKDWQRAALAQLSVFEGGFTVAAAEAVLDLSAHPEAPWAVDVVQGLLERALVRRVGPERFGMLVSVQEYARGKLGQAAPETWARHGRYFARLGAREALDALHGHGGTERRKALPQELDNLVAANRRAAARGDGEVAASTALAAWEVFAVQGPLSAAAALLEGTAERFEERRASVYLKAAVTRQWCGQMDRARAHYERALALAQETGDRAQESAALGALGYLSHDTGQVEQARAHYEAALALHREVGDQRLEARTHFSLGNLHSDQGQMDVAREHYEAALAIYRQHEDHDGEADVLGNLGNLYRRQGLLTTSREHYEAALRLARSLGDRRSEGIVLGNYGDLCAELGLVEQARERYEAALAIHREVGNRQFEGYALGCLGSFHAERGRLVEGREHYEAALAVLREVGDLREEGQVLGNLGCLHAALGQPAEARACLERACAIHQQMGSRNLEAYALNNLGNLFQEQGQPEEALRHYEAALLAAREAGDRRLEAIVLGPLGLLHAGQARSEESLACFDTAERVLTELSDLVQLAVLSLHRAEAEHLLNALDRARAYLHQAEQLAPRVQATPESELGRALTRVRALLAQ